MEGGGKAARRQREGRGKAESRPREVKKGGKERGKAVGGKHKKNRGKAANAEETQRDCTQK
eukprot:1176984-Prymnesium_polylepis.1